MSPQGDREVECAMTDPPRLAETACQREAGEGTYLRQQI